jgi:hypothetical protein
MLNNVGIIPAAGNAVRFGGIFKELLPLKNTTLLEQAVERLSHCDAVILVSNADKIHDHATILGDRVIYTIQTRGRDIWGALVTAMEAVDGYRYTMTMPDTYMPTDSLRKPPPNCEIGLWTFQTNTPERFGCLIDGRVVDKDAAVLRPATAWGALTWTSNVRDFWFDRPWIETCTEAINLAMGSFAHNTEKLGFYHDVASLKDYAELIAW